MIRFFDVTPQILDSPSDKTRTLRGDREGKKDQQKKRREYILYIYI
jgi:hypothetical protein